MLTGATLDDIIFVREDDPRCDELVRNGYIVVGYSWGANLKLDDQFDVSELVERVTNVTVEGYVLRELSCDDFKQVVLIERANARDYPVTPATHHSAPTVEALLELVNVGSRLWGAYCGENLVAVTLLKPREGRWNTEFTSVVSSHRGRGIGSALKSASVVALFNEGGRWFSTGGAESNSASLGANRALGYVLEPRWRTYAKKLTSPQGEAQE